MSEVVFRGTSGKIGAIYSHSSNSEASAVLIMTVFEKDKAQKKSPFAQEFEDGLFDVFVKHGFSVLRFDAMEQKVPAQPVIGESEDGHLSDIAAALDWLHSRNIECRDFWMCGVDCGALLALQMVMRRPEIKNYIIISPNMKKVDLSFIVPSTACGLIIKGSDDQKFSENDCLNLQDKLITKAESKVRYTVIEKTDRYFQNKIDELKLEISDHVYERLVDSRKNVKRIIVGKRRRRKKRNSNNEDDKIIYTSPIKGLDIDDI